MMLTRKEVLANQTENMSLKELNEAFDIKNVQYIETPWTILEAYFKDQHLVRLVRHQLESYNNFVSHQIIKTI